jgi:hypothetical protein
MTGRISPQMDEIVGSGMVLLPGLRTVVGVTAADQGQQQLPTDEFLKKPIKAQKMTGDNSSY